MAEERLSLHWRNIPRFENDWDGTFIRDECVDHVCGPNSSKICFVFKASPGSGRTSHLLESGGHIKKNVPTSTNMGPRTFRICNTLRVNRGNIRGKIRGHAQISSPTAPASVEINLQYGNFYKHSILNFAWQAEKHFPDSSLPKLHSFWRSEVACSWMSLYCRRCTWRLQQPIGRLEQGSRNKLIESLIREYFYGAIRS